MGAGRALRQGFTRSLVPLLLLGLTALLLVLALRTAPPLQVDVGDEGDLRFLSGFYTPETGFGESFRWSGPEAWFVLHGAPADPTVFLLQLSGERLLAQGAPEVALIQGTSEVARFAVQAGWRSYEILLPSGAVATPAGSALPLALETAVSTPGASDTARDFRPLGLPVSHVGVAALEGPHTPALIRSLWLTWLLALVAGSLALLDALLLPRRRASLWLRASLVIGFGGTILILWAARDPFGLAWVLPPTPWILGTGTLLLGVGLVFALAGDAERGDAQTPEGGAGKRPSPLVGEGLGVGGTSGFALVTGMALLAVAVGLLHTQTSLAGGLILALVALMLVTGGPYGLGKDGWAHGGPDLSQKYALLLLGLILVLAIGLRLFRLDEMPFGLWRDEARHGLFAQRIRDYPDYRPIYIANENLDASQLDLNAAPLSIHLPALGLYPFALALHLWGENLWSMRVMSGLGGALTVVPLYGFATWLSGRRSIGLVAAFLLAVSSWHITVSRLVFPTIFDPLLTLSGLWLLGLGLSGGGRTAHVYPPILSHTTGSPLARGTDARPGHHRFFWMAYCLLGGASIGLAMQTYHTGRLAPVAAAWLALVLLLREPQAWRGWLRGSLVASLGLLLTVTPLLLFALNQPEAFNDRVGEVFLLSDEARQGAAPLEMLDQAFRQHLLMFHVQGDLNGRHHAPGRPMFDYVTGIGLLLGSVVLLRSVRDWRTLIVAGLFLLGLAPSALAVDAPHGMRSLNAAAYGVIIAALGWSALGWSLRQRGVQLARGMRRSIVAMLASLVIVLNATVYFVVMPPQREVFLVFYPVQSQMGAYIRAVANENGGELPRQIYVAEGLKNDQIFMFLTSGLHIETFRGASLSAPPEPGALFLFGGYFADEEAAVLAPILGTDAAPTGSGPAFPDGQGVTFYMYEVGVSP
ncbi:phospholipid carrier-dependent glycosyltransferase [Candidatus Chloroploca asiatica]|uniref:ArnT-like N-terminal domain-containing protein n=1 Tax=Candidatus Chloroploca asiatica TaxID=1506545 RepID=A0A2H3KJX9_9CHLR|nr:phospholipid carrier-dependent glycosyltransferase [Candidatus Chloroploca asiatica]PDV98264.1 hypothetical protein A9Q02_16230 [Candidatus Chloroploca asiatica]